jgi:uncharacterized membrane-anchored protein YhcB (DUF1043 family)
MEIIQAIIPSLVGAFATGAITWCYTRSGLGQRNVLLDTLLNNSKEKIDKLAYELESAKQQINNLTSELRKAKDLAQKYEKVKQQLQASSVVKEYLQPVIIVGSRAVGKSSLLAQWRAPWDYSRLEPTQTHNTSTVPIYDFKKNDLESHFADSAIMTDVYVHLKLKVHDFPGELRAQEKIVEEARKETLNLRERTGKALGLALIPDFSQVRKNDWFKSNHE